MKCVVVDQVATYVDSSGEPSELIARILTVGDNLRAVNVKDTDIIIRGNSIYVKADVLGHDTVKVALGTGTELEVSADSVVDIEE